MKYIRKVLRIFNIFSNAFRKAYRKTAYSAHPLLVVLLVFGLATAAIDVSQGIYTQLRASDIAESMRNFNKAADEMAYQDYKAGHISAYDLQVARERNEMLQPVFDQAADIIEIKGYDIAANACMIGVIESIFAYNPGAKAGSLVRAVSRGKALDLIISMGFSANTLENLITNPDVFSIEERDLNQRLFEEFKHIESLGDFALFIARMRAKINFLRKEWINQLEKNPCQSASVYYRVKDENKEKIKDWANHPVQLVGENEIWKTIDEFSEWIMAEAINSARNEDITKTWQGQFDMANVPLEDCLTCAPPSYTNTIKLTVNLDTCEVEGEIKGQGSGDGVKSTCEGGNECNVYATVIYEGLISGTVNADGKLNLDPATISFDYNATFEGCENQPDGTVYDTVKDTITITGFLDWQGDANGEASFPESRCLRSGSWIVSPE